MRSYVFGEPIRHLQTRIADHEGVSSRTNRPHSQPPNDGKMEHADETSYGLVFKSFIVMSRYKDFDIEITERVVIHKMRHSLKNHNP